MKPFVSILLPSRNRQTQLIDCIKSIKDSSSKIAYTYEIVLRLHRDDVSTVFMIPHLLKLDNIKIVIGSPLKGYGDLSRFYDDAAAVADGDFIWVMNDDVIVSGRHWDTALNNAPANHIIMPEIHRLGLSEYKRDMDTPFMFLPNKCWERYGIKKFDTPFDHGLWGLLRRNGWPTYFLPGVIVHHDREDDKTLLPKRREDEEYMENL